MPQSIFNGVFVLGNCWNVDRFLTILRIKKELEAVAGDKLLMNLYTSFTRI